MNLLQIHVEWNSATASNSPAPPSLHMNHSSHVTSLISAWWGWSYWQIRVRNWLPERNSSGCVASQGFAQTVQWQEQPNKGITLNELLTSELDGVKLSASCSDHLTFKEKASIPHVHLIGGWVGPGPFWKLRRGKCLLPLSRIEPRFKGCLARSLVSTLTELPWRQ
jgi:hypothetical protein